MSKEESIYKMNSIESCGLSRNEILRGEWFIKEGDNS